MSQAMEWSSSLDKVSDERPRWSAPKTTYCSNPISHTYSPVSARVNNGGDLEAYGLYHLSAEESVLLAKWILDTFGESKEKS